METVTVDPLFSFHKLNDAGQTKAKAIAEAFTDLKTRLTGLDALDGRSGALVSTHLETACFHAKKSMAQQLTNRIE